MKLLFIFSKFDYQNPKKPLGSQEEIQFGISIISSFLQSKGHKTDLLVLTRKTKWLYIFNYIKDFNPDIIGFTAVSTEYKFIFEVAKEIKIKFPSKYLIIGGSHTLLHTNF